MIKPGPLDGGPSLQAYPRSTRTSPVRPPLRATSAEIAGNAGTAASNVLYTANTNGI